MDAEVVVAAYRAEIDRLQKLLDAVLRDTDDEQAMQLESAIIDLEEEIAFLVIFEDG